MWQPVLMINGFLISIVGVAMCVPASFDVFIDQLPWSPFLSAALIALFVGLSLFLANRGEIGKITLQQGYLLTVVSWCSVLFLGALPFWLSGCVENFSDAIFETMSGLSTTGATIFSDVEVLPKSILLWRSILNCLGGIGIVIFAAAMLPFLGIGGMQIFQRENSDTNEKFMPKFRYIAKRIMFVYIFLTICCGVALFYAGMDWFDAANHAMASIATGGLSTKNASIGAYHSIHIEVVIMIAMIAGSLPMTFYVILLQRKELRGYGISQIKAFFKVLFVYIMSTSVFLTYLGVYDFPKALQYASFNIISIVTSTGFVSTDYMSWGNWVGPCFIVFALTGGCTGSTSGSVKIFRWQVIAAYIKRSLVIATEPNRIFPVKIGQDYIDNAIVSSVFLFFTMFLLSILFLSCLIALAGYDFEIAFSSVVACMTNSGPGLGSLIGPAGNYSSLNDFAKYVLTFAMMLGRLEILTVLALFSKSFWSQC